MRTRSPFSIIVWLGVAAVLALAIVLAVELNQATGRSKTALGLGKLNGVYVLAHDAPTSEARQQMLAAAIALDPSQRSKVDAIQRLRGKAQDAAILHEADTAGMLAQQIGDRAYASERRVVEFARIEVVLGFIVFGALWLILRAARNEKFERLAEMASTDPLTGLRNHRVFHEDLARELQRTSRTGVPLALVLLDLDDLKSLNDTHGHQAGDQRIRALADTLRATLRASDTAYRIGGDEFAVILPDARSWGALEFTQRLRHALPGFGATAGITDAETLVARDELIHDADMALLAAKRSHQQAIIYTPELEPAQVPDTIDEQHNQTLASALARAVDAKDAYTRSHCQTVSQLAAVVAAELGFEGERLAKLRLAGLLHDVGKIGIPDAILNKPAALTDGEYEVMKSHAQLGYEIVEAAGLSEQAQWVRHHHERIDGRGYPDGIAGEDIPLESRIILVADAFEAMTSDRPYRRAPGREFALAELQRGAGSQFDPAVVDALTRVLERTGEPALTAH